MAKPIEDPTLVHASPTKEFFIDILIRDVALAPAINDLIDNCVDGAHRIRPRGNFSGLEVAVEFNKNRFSISDNCGGIPIDIARNYAFRFGRDPKTPSVKGSIGQFGVGMKRTLFKLGNNIRIESTAKDASFAIDLDVEKWKAKQEWDLHFTDLREDEDNPQEACGTTITVEGLHKTVASELSLSSFDLALRTLVQTTHSQNLEAGLAITLNGRSLVGPHLALLSSSEVSPVFRERTMTAPAGQKVEMRLFAGTSVSNPNDAGWYISCNGRMILQADQSNVTGWGEGKQAGIPKYHNQYAMFRGFVFLDSNDGDSLPWNTTKTSVDTEHPIFQAARLEMLTAMRPIIEALNKIDAEKDKDKQPNTNAMQRAASVPLRNIKRNATFVIAPKAPPTKPEERFSTIRYERPEKLVKQVQNKLNAGSLKEVGEKTFDYYYNLECK